ncbi:Piwi-domain-containing protein [Serendipita vermifera]|nr:Piwi-domain-containing protein [Serendipita vermifera]
MIQENRSKVFRKRPSYDGRKNLFSPEDLGPNGEFTVNLHSKKYIIKLQLANRVELSTLLQMTRSFPDDPSQFLTAITLLNILVRSDPSTRRTVTTRGRAFFIDDGGRNLNVFELWHGYIQSVRPSIGRIIVNVDSTVGLMYPRGDLVTALLNFMGFRNAAQFDMLLKDGDIRTKRARKQIEKYVRNLKVILKHRRGPKNEEIIKVMRNLIWESATEHEFDGEDGVTNVADYFGRFFGRLRYPNLPILAVWGKAAIPLEQLHIYPGQPYLGAIPDSERAGMLSASSRKPHARLDHLRRNIESLGHQNSDYLKDAEMTIGTQFMKVNARVLGPPGLNAGFDRRINLDPKKGSWNMTQHTLYRPTAEIMKMYVVNIEHRQGDEQGVDQLVRIWKQMGITFTHPRGYATPANFDEIAMDRMVWNDFPANKKPLSLPAAEDVPPLLALFIVPDSAKVPREHMKWWGDIHAGIATQVLKASKMRQTGNSFDQYARNVGLKINAKLGGINIAPSARNTIFMTGGWNTMVFGIDTSHPSPGSNFPTTAAMVFSIDEMAVEYRSIVRFQQPRQEAVMDLRKMTLSALKRFSRGGKIPGHLIFYRDGVSEGQFQQIEQIELAAIKGALDDMMQELQRVPQFANAKRPTVTFIIVGKKHHIRFLPPDSRDPDRNPDLLDRNENAVPGTVVDTDITTPDPKVFDFYMQSHGSILGTSRPAHYSVIYDERGVNANDLQQFSHNLCHVYQIATRSVSIPAPVYYADQVAARSAIHFYEALNGRNNDLASRISDEVTSEEWLGRAGQAELHRRTSDRMYWL